MKIVLNEKKYAEEVLLSKSLDNKATFDLRILAKYYSHEKELKPKKIYNELVNIMENKYDRFSIAKWQQTLLDLSKNAKKYPLIEIDNIPITTNELITINSIERKPMKRFAFTILCLAKYRNLINPNNNDWINYKFGDIFKMANTQLTKREQGIMVYEMKKNGLITMNKMTNNLSINVCYIDKDESEEILHITDFRNLGYEYLLYCGENFIRCQECGILVRQNETNNRKYCNDCAKYRPIGSKTIKCVDCGKDVEVDAKDNETCRCLNCKSIYVKNRDKTRKQKYREKLSHAQIKS